MSDEAGRVVSTESPMRRFMRDVIVNLLANLVAAAIIYLLGVATKLFPVNLSLVIVALTVVVMAASMGSFVWFLVAIRRGERARSRTLLYWMVIFAGLAITGIGVGALLETGSLHALWLVGIGLVNLVSGLSMGKSDRDG